MPQTQKVNNSTSNQTAKASKKPVAASVYGVEEFAKAPDSLGAKSADIVRAALTTKGKTSYTIEEAKTIVEKFVKKEVK